MRQCRHPVRGILQGATPGAYSSTYCGAVHIQHAPLAASQPAAGAAPGPRPPRGRHTAAAPLPRRAAGKPHPTAAMGGRVGAGGCGAAVSEAGRQVMHWAACAEEPTHRRAAHGVQASLSMAATVECRALHDVQLAAGVPLACAAPPPAAPPTPASCGWRCRQSAAESEAPHPPAAPAARLAGLLTLAAPALAAAALLLLLS